LRRFSFGYILPRIRYQSASAVFYFGTMSKEVFLMSQTAQQTEINEDKMNAFLGKVVGDFGASLGTILAFVVPETRGGTDLNARTAFETLLLFL
jgi:hypothetical protein